MNQSIPSDTANSAKNLAQQIAKQIAREPLEILQDIKEQTTGETNPTPEQSNKNSQSGNPSENVHAENVIADKQKSSRLIEALNRELEDIKKQNLFKEIQGRIAMGEIVPLHEYTQLTMEQRQVLSAQMEAVAQQKRLRDASSFQDVPTITSKPSRRFGAGQKQQAQKEQTRVEKPVPPSG
jgi:hypothetical protein